MAHIFISYSRKDGSKFAETLANRLRALEHDVFLDVHSIRGGAKWRPELQQKIQWAGLLVVLVTPASNDSDYVYTEIRQAEAEGKMILPVQINDAPLPVHLRGTWQAVKQEGENVEAVLLEIERTLKSQPAQPPTPVGPGTSSRRSIPLVWMVVFIALAAVLSGGLVFWRTHSEDVAGVIIPDSCPYTSTRALISAVPEDAGGEIIVPIDCSTHYLHDVGIAARGVYSEALEGKTPWLLVYADGNYWPQAIDGCNAEHPIFTESGDGRWIGRFHLGEADTQYDVVLVMTEAGSEADQTFLEYYDSGCKTGSFLPFRANQLPNGIIELDAITVHTR